MLSHTKSLGDAHPLDVFAYTLRPGDEFLTQGHRTGIRGWFAILSHRETPAFSSGTA
jgi:hypothetical protein